METIASRLEDAIGRWARPEGKTGSIRGLHEALQAAGVENASYGNVRNFVKNPRSRPPMPMLEEAARILGVRKEWLVLGTEPRTEEEGKERANRDQANRRAVAGRHTERIQTIVGCIHEALQLERSDADVFPVWAAAALDLWERWMEVAWVTRRSAGHGEGSLSAEEQHELAHQVASAIATPPATLDPIPDRAERWRPLVDMDSDELDDYVLSMIRTLQRYVRWKAIEPTRTAVVTRHRTPRGVVTTVRPKTPERGRS
jgi:hypothetical protein